MGRVALSQWHWDPVRNSHSQAGQMRPEVSGVCLIGLELKHVIGSDDTRCMNTYGLLGPVRRLAVAFRTTGLILGSCSRECLTCHDAHPP